MPPTPPLSEADICYRFVDPALDAAGWRRKHIRREYRFTAGQIHVRGNLIGRGKKKAADYLLMRGASVPLAIIEAKKPSLSVGAGMQQALAYAEELDVPFAFSTNGSAFLFHDRTGTYPEVERLLTRDQFPSSDELWHRYKVWRGLEAANDEVITSPCYSEPGGKKPRYYQQLAINRVVEAVANGQRRCLLVMATGTGKTYTAYNIIWRLWKTGVVKRALFLADRNILIDQTMLNDFRPFAGGMKKLNRKLVDASTGKIDTSYEIYLGLYQAVVGGEGREPLYSKFPADFFDLVVIDECHRGSAKDDSAWREVLDYFESAVQLGLTATPKETRYVSNMHYFGEPVFTYSLRRGIADGFLAPYKVIRVNLDIDQDGWTPEAGQTDDHGQNIEARTYNLRDFDRNIVFPQRTKLVAERISQFLHGTNPMNKTIVFCGDIDHAERMRQALVNVPANRPFVDANRHYVVRITGAHGSESDEGAGQLDKFITPKEKYPVIATTSKLLSTGVDAQTCHVIVLDRRIQSMIEFKQIIGRGTRVRSDYGKHYFTIIDFRGATALFADPDWDGPPIQVYEPGGADEVVPPPVPDGDGTGDGGWDNDAIDEVIFDGNDPEATDGFDDDDHGDGMPLRRYRVGDQSFAVRLERISYYGKDGELITESLRDYTRHQVRDEFRSLDDFVRRWTDADRKQAVIDELLEQGVILQAVEDMVGADYDPFDLICHVAFDQPPLTRRERADNVRKRDVFTKYGEHARAVLERLLDKYADQGIAEIDDIGVLKVYPFNELGTPIELVRHFGGKARYKQALRDLQRALYGPAKAA